MANTVETVVFVPLVIRCYGKESTHYHHGHHVGGFHKLSGNSFKRVGEKKTMMLYKELDLGSHFKENDFAAFM